MSISVITIEFEGIVQSVEENQNPHLEAQMPVGSQFKGSFQFCDTSDLWPEPAEYTTPNLTSIFRIECAGGFIKTIIFAVQTSILYENGPNKLWVYGHTDNAKEEQWTFGMGFDFTVDASGTIQWDFTTQPAVSLSATVGGQRENGPPELVNSVMHGQATSIKQPTIVQTESIITIGFQGHIDSVEENKAPYLDLLMPVGRQFKGSFQFYDTRELWPQPGEYTTPDLTSIFRIESSCFTKTIIFAVQTNVLSENGQNKFWVYGHTDDSKERQWTFGIGFNFTVDTSGTIQWDFTQPNISLSVTMGGLRDDGPPEWVNSVMRGQATSIEQPGIVKSPVGSQPLSPPTGFQFK